jgi:hypothetical protein
MRRALPLADPTETITKTAAPSDKIAGTVSVYDPAMCCPTGVCGPGVNPALLTIMRDLRWLENRGATVERFGLAHQPNAFVANSRVSELMQEFGNDALPVVLVNGDVFCHGRYPSRDELVAALEARRQMAPKRP